MRRALRFWADAQLDFPTLAHAEWTGRNRFELEGADGGDAGAESHRHDVPFAPAGGGQCHLDGGEFLELTGLPPFELRTRMVVAPGRRTAKAEAHFFAHDGADL